MRIVRIIAYLLVGWQCTTLACDTLQIVSYNVENLFDNQHDSLKDDIEFTTDGNRHWTYRRYQNKIDHIAQVLVGIGKWETPCMVGLCEVENTRCLRDLCWKMRRYNYRFVHYDSPDERGIDVALLYDSTQVSILHSQPLHVDLHDDNTRDILYAQTLIRQQDTLHIFVCHLPSQREGAAQTEWKRKTAKQILQTQIDSILHNQPGAAVIVMGDMNGEPQDDLTNMYNLMCNISLTSQQPYGTHRYNGIWSYLDQFYVSDALQHRVTASVFAQEWLLEEDKKYLGLKPKRTFVGFRYQNGYSDHLPIVLKLCL